MVYEGFNYEKIYFPRQTLDPDMHPMMHSVPIRARKQQGQFKTPHKKVVNEKSGGLNENKIRILKAP